VIVERYAMITYQLCVERKGGRTKSWTLMTLKGVEKVYSNEQRKIALQLYDQCKSVSKVIQHLGYPTRRGLCNWIAERDLPSKTKVRAERECKISFRVNRI